MFYEHDDFQSTKEIFVYYFCFFRNLKRITVKTINQGAPVVTLISCSGDHLFESRSGHEMSLLKCCKILSVPHTNAGGIELLFLGRWTCSILSRLNQVLWTAELLKFVCIEWSLSYFPCSKYRRTAKNIIEVNLSQGRYL